MTRETPDEIRARVHAMTLDALLASNRFDTPGVLHWQGVEGDIRHARLAQLRADDPAAWVRASKRVGWGS